MARNDSKWVEIEIAEANMPMHLEFKPDFWRTVTWSRPDSPTPAICSCCKGQLPKVPLMLWRDDGSAISVCDDCIERGL